MYMPICVTKLVLINLKIHKLWAPENEGLALLQRNSPRARGVLFTLSRPKGLRVGPIVEKCAEFRNPFLKKNVDGSFLRNWDQTGVPPFQNKSHELDPLSYVSVNFSAKRQLRLKKIVSRHVALDYERIHYNINYLSITAIL